jgi:predicted dehydrogenase
VWTDRCGGWWPQGIDRPAFIDPIPANFRWDLWLGAAPYRPYAAGKKDSGFDGYAPFRWRGFWDFGTGSLGDMACHIANLPYFALELTTPESVEAESTGVNKETAPKQSTIRYRFPANGKRGPVTMTWYDGGRLPPQELLPGVKLKSGGFLLVGDQGKLYSPTDYGETYELYPKEKFAGYKPPTPWLPRSPGQHAEWLQGVLTGVQPMANFEYASPLTESMLLGNVALRAGQRITYDAASGRVTNCPAAEQYIRKEYRRDFRLPTV